MTLHLCTVTVTTTENTSLDNYKGSCGASLGWWVRALRNHFWRNTCEGMWGGMSIISVSCLVPGDTETFLYTKFITQWIKCCQGTNNRFARFCFEFEYLFLSRVWVVSVFGEPFLCVRVLFIVNTNTCRNCTCVNTLPLVVFTSVVTSSEVSCLH
jgi:hypothetical protein